jgi:predicted nucleotidyltransferase
MMTGIRIGDIEKNMTKGIKNILEEFKDKCREKFCLDLVSIVLFGSYARGTATKYSDIDLLVVVKNLPRDWRRRDKVLDDFERYFLKKSHKRIFPILTTPEAIINSVKRGNPLFYGIMTGYTILFDRNDFFKSEMEEVKAMVRVEKPIFYDKEGKWNLAEI